MVYLLCVEVILGFHKLHNVLKFLDLVEIQILEHRFQNIPFLCKRYISELLSGMLIYHGSVFVPKWIQYMVQMRFQNLLPLPKWFVTKVIHGKLVHVK